MLPCPRVVETRSGTRCAAEGRRSFLESWARSAGDGKAAMAAEVTVEGEKRREGANEGCSAPELLVG